MTIYAQTRRELAAEPSQRQRLDLMLKSFAQRLQEGEAEALLQDLKSNREAWIATLLAEPEAPKEEAPAAKPPEPAAEPERPRRFLRS